MKTISLILNICMLIALIPSLGMAITSPMIFGSGATNRTWWLFGSVILLPILIIGTQYFAWSAYNQGQFGTAIKIGLIPLIDLAFIGIMFWISGSLK